MAEPSGHALTQRFDLACGSAQPLALVDQELLAFTAWALVGVYLLKGVGSYASSYLMADVGQRVGAVEFL